MATTAPTMKPPPYSEPDYAQTPAKATDLPWYRADISKYLTPDVSNLLESYAGIPTASQSKHVHMIRDKAWNIRSYPITGLGVFMDPYIAKSPARAQIVERLKQGGWFMDVGCFLGVDFRQLIVDGAPSDKMVGVDIVRQWDIGFEMYRDEDRFQGRFIEEDILKADDNREMASLKGKVNVIGISAVMHQWDWDTQVAAAQKLVAFSKPGTIVAGYQIGNTPGGNIEMKAGTMVMKVFRQSAESFEKMWNAVGEATGTTWETKASLMDWDFMGVDEADTKWLEEGSGILDFVVTRVK